MNAASMNVHAGTGPANRVARVRRPYWMLLKKEASQALPMFIIFILGIAGWQAFLYTRLGKWPVEPIIGLSMLPIGAVPFWLLWRSYSTLRQEWTGNHMYLLLSLPIPGWYIASVKVLIVMVETFLYMVVTVGGASVLAAAAGLLNVIPVELANISWGTVAWVVLISIYSPLEWIVPIQFAYIAGRLASRYSGVVSFITFLLSGWFIVRAATLLAVLLRWLPTVPIRGQAFIDGIPIQSAVHIKPGPGIGMVVAVFMLFWLGSSFLERDVEL